MRILKHWMCVQKERKTGEMMEQNKNDAFDREIQALKQKAMHIDEMLENTEHFDAVFFNQRERMQRRKSHRPKVSSEENMMASNQERIDTLFNNSVRISRGEPIEEEKLSSKEEQSFEEVSETTEENAMSGKVDKVIEHADHYQKNHQSDKMISDAVSDQGKSNVEMLKSVLDSEVIFDGDIMQEAVIENQSDIIKDQECPKKTIEAIVVEKKPKKPRPVIHLEPVKINWAQWSATGGLVDIDAEEKAAEEATRIAEEEAAQKAEAIKIAEKEEEARIAAENAARERKSLKSTASPALEIVRAYHKEKTADEKDSKEEVKEEVVENRAEETVLNQSDVIKEGEEFSGEELDLIFDDFEIEVMEEETSKCQKSEHVPVQQEIEIEEKVSESERILPPYLGDQSANYEKRQREKVEAFFEEINKIAQEEEKKDNVSSEFSDFETKHIEEGINKPDAFGMDVEKIEMPEEDEFNFYEEEIQMESDDFPIPEAEVLTETETLEPVFDENKMGSQIFPMVGFPIFGEKAIFDDNQVVGNPEIREEALSSEEEVMPLDEVIMLSKNQKLEFDLGISEESSCFEEKAIISEEAIEEENPDTPDETTNIDEGLKKKPIFAGMSFIKGHKRRERPKEALWEENNLNEVQPIDIGSSESYEASANDQQDDDQIGPIMDAFGETVINEEVAEDQQSNEEIMTDFFGEHSKEMEMRLAAMDEFFELSKNEKEIPSVLDELDVRNYDKKDDFAESLTKKESEKEKMPVSDDSVSLDLFFEEELSDDFEEDEISETEIELIEDVQPVENFDTVGDVFFDEDEPVEDDGNDEAISPGTEEYKFFDDMPSLSQDSIFEEITEIKESPKIIYSEIRTEEVPSEELIEDVFIFEEDILSDDLIESEPIFEEKIIPGNLIESEPIFEEKILSEELFTAEPVFEEEVIPDNLIGTEPVFEEEIL